LRLWRKFTFVNRRKAKKPTEREAFGCKALGKANCEDDSERSELAIPY
jgi:hypothetical protein